jgi:hypothetical protein
MDECGEYGDELQMEKHVFWDCELYENQRATMLESLSQNSKKVTELLRPEEKKICARRLLLHKQNF